MIKTLILLLLLSTGARGHEVKTPKGYLSLDNVRSYEDVDYLFGSLKCKVWWTLTNSKSTIMTCKQLVEEHRRLEGLD